MRDSMSTSVEREPVIDDACRCNRTISTMMMIANARSAQMMRACIGQSGKMANAAKRIATTA